MSEYPKISQGFGIAGNNENRSKALLTCEGQQLFLPCLPAKGRACHTTSN